MRVERWANCASRNSDPTTSWALKFSDGYWVWRNTSGTLYYYSFGKSWGQKFEGSVEELFDHLALLV